MKERRNKWRKVCKCVEPKHPPILLPGQLDVCNACGKVIVVLKRREDMQNVDKFRTGPRPMVITRKGYDYDTLIEALKKYKPTTECVILSEKEISSNQITHLRVLCRKLNLGWIKVCKKTGLKGVDYHMWLVDEGGETK
jgi:hypothetical protein